ncbi:MAG: translational machinery protein [Polyangiaceae bacterium]
MNARHVAVWIDHQEAKIFSVEAETFELRAIAAPHHHVARKADEQGRHADTPFFHRVALALEGSEHVIVVGPSSAKLDFIRHVTQHHHALEKKIVGVETLDHPTDKQFVAYARHYFRARDL